MQSSESYDEGSIQNEEDGYFSDDDQDNQNLPLIFSSFPKMDLSIQNRSFKKIYSSCSFKACLGIAILLIIGILVVHRYNPSSNDNEDREPAGSSWLVGDSAENQAESVISSCEEEFFLGMTWKSWLLQLQRSNLAQGRCRNPLAPRERATELGLWKSTFERNKELVHQSISHDSRALDIVFFGDSITEHWLGTDLGQPRGHYQDIAPVYEAFFRTQSAPLHGLALGIGGDRCPNLLYRIMEGEMPDEMQPKIFWILIGTNDFGGDKCSVDAITAGNIAIAHYILNAKPDARIVLNSILPRGKRDLTRGDFPVLRAVNQRLECFASATDRVHFFNATDYFTTADGRFVNMTLMSDDVHPGRLGSEIWAQGITNFALDLIRTIMDESTATPSNHVCNNSEIYYQGKLWEDWVQAQGLKAVRCVTRGPKQNNVNQKDCQCVDPTQARSKGYPDWKASHARNVALAKEEITKSNIHPLDVVLYGDSIVECWQGVFMGKSLKQLRENLSVYNDIFRSNSSLVRGLGLGISGDQSVNLLYRLENGELPQELDSPIFWLLVGTNDWGVAHCNEDMITASVLKVVSLLCLAKPDAQVVINSILPRGQDLLVNSDSWRVFKIVNERLQCYAAAHENVSFFNATDIFLTGQGDGIRVDGNMMRDFLHPNAQGYKAWGDQIVNTVLEML